MTETPSPEVEEQTPKGLGSRLRLSVLRDYGIVIAFAIIFVALSFASPVFLTSRNLLNILDQQAAIGMIAVGGTLVLIAGGLDLSTGAVFALAGVVAALMVPVVGVPLCFLIALLVAVALGLGNGLLATIGRINSIIVTLASGIMIRGLAIAITGGLLVRVDEPAYTTLGRGSFLGLKYSIWLFLIVTILAGFTLRYTTFGRYVYAAGGNPEAARLSGVQVNRVRATTFVISAFTAGLAGILISSRVATGQADTGMGLEISAIAAIVIGGTSLLGGEGAVWRTIIGLMLLALVRNGFNLLNIPVKSWVWSVNRGPVSR